MSYLQGAGTAFDPYIIHNYDAFVYYLTNHIFTGVYAEIVADIDMLGLSLTYDGTSRIPNGYLNGNGRTLSNLTFNPTINSAIVRFNAKWQNLQLNNVNFGTSYGMYSTSSPYGSFNDCVFTQCKINQYSSNKVGFVRCVIISCTVGGTVVNTNSYTAAGSILGNTTNVTTDPYNPDSYPVINTNEDWVLDGGSFPRLYYQDVASLTQVYLVKGITKVGGAVCSRHCRAHSTLDFHQIAHAVSDAVGSYSLNCGYYNDHIFVTHSDDYGDLLVVSKSYALGDYIHPAIPNGYRYKCTTAGTSDSSLPTEPWSTAQNLTSGTASFTPEPIYKPETLLVVPHLYDLLTDQPVS